MFILEWNKCKGDIWCDLFKLDLEHEYIVGVHGVYVLWHGDSGNYTPLKVGYGEINNELFVDRKDLAIQAFSHLGVKVSWAEVQGMKRKGVYAWLKNKLNPKIITDLQAGSPIECNLPWDDNAVPEE